MFQHVKTFVVLLATLAAFAGKAKASSVDDFLHQISRVHDNVVNTGNDIAAAEEKAVTIAQELGALDAQLGVVTAKRIKVRLQELDAQLDSVEASIEAAEYNLVTLGLSLKMFDRMAANYDSARVDAAISSAWSDFDAVTKSDVPAATRALEAARRKLASVLDKANEILGQG